MNLGFIEVAVKFAEVMQECDRLCAVKDPTEEPFKSKYAAERALKSLASTLTDDRVAEIAGPDEPIVEALLDLRAPRPLDAGFLLASAVHAAARRMTRLRLSLSLALFLLCFSSTTPI